MSKLVHIFQNNRQEGPYTVDQIHSMLESGAIAPITLAWTDGMAEWAPLNTVLPLGISKTTPQPPPNLQSSVTQSAPPPLQTTTAQSGPSGTGGWLSFFCIQLTVFGPLLGLGQLFNAWDTSKGAFQSYPDLRTVFLWSSVASAVLIIYGFIVGVVIWSGSPKGRTRAKQFLLVSFLGFILTETVSVMLMGDLPRTIQDAALRGSLSTGMQRVIYTVVWWIYFARSKRVRNTYG